MPAAVHVDGLRELVRDLRKIERGLPAALRREMLPISQMVYRGSISKGASLGGVHAHAVKRGLRAGATANTAWIKLVATKEPSVLGAEFGGQRGPRTQQFPPWRGSGSNAGYFVYPTIRARSDEVMQRTENALVNILRLAGFR